MNLQCFVGALDAIAPSDHQWSKLRTPTRWDLHTTNGKVMLGGKLLSTCYLVCFVIFNFQSWFISLSSCLLTLFNALMIPDSDYTLLNLLHIGESGCYKDASLWVHSLQLWSINAQYFVFNFQSHQAPLLPNSHTCTCVHSVVESKWNRLHTLPLGARNKNPTTDTVNTMGKQMDSCVNRNQNQLEDLLQSARTAAVLSWTRSEFWR